MRPWLIQAVCLDLKEKSFIALERGENGHWQGRKGNSDRKNSLDKSREAEKYRKYKMKWKFGWRCLKGHKGD